MRFVLGIVFGIVFGMALLIGCPPPDPANPSQGSIAPESVEIKNPPAETLFAGAEIRLETEVLPANATDKSLTWTVSPEETVVVNNGVLTALKEGEATVTVSTSNGKTDSFTVTVSGTAAPASVTVDGTEYLQIFAENFVSSDILGLSGDKHRVEDGVLKIDADLGAPGEGANQTFSVFPNNLYNLMRVRFKINDHNPNFRVKTTGIDLIYLYEHDKSGENYLDFKAELYPDGQSSGGVTEFYNESVYSREKASHFVDVDILRKENQILIYMNGELQMTFNAGAILTDEGFLQGKTDFVFGVWWGDAGIRTDGTNGAEIEYIALYADELIEKRDIALIPEPVEFTEGTGFFIINEQTKIDDQSGTASNAVSLFKERIRKSSGIDLVSGEADSNVIRLIPDGDIQNAEGYRLSVTAKTVEIHANGYGGFLYGLNTLLQLMPPEVLSQTPVDGLKLSAACCEIEDEPRFEWRGFMLDVARQFFDAEMVKQVLDELSLVKINRFHWHLTDDGGIRFPFKGQFTTSAGNTYDFDQFMKKVAWRTGPNKDSTNWPNRDYETIKEDGWHYFDPNDPKDPYYQYRDNKHGGSYTEEEIRDVINYAKMRNIEVIPEFDMPGHCGPLYDWMIGTAADGSEVNLRCDGHYAAEGDSRSGVEGKDLKPGSDTDLCVSNPDTVEVLGEMIRQMKAVFSTGYMHIGADEVKINPSSWYLIGHWWYCQRCENKVKELLGESATVSYASFQKLQAWFLGEIEPYARDGGTRMGMWNEATKGGFQPQPDGFMHAWDSVGSQTSVKIINCYTDHYYLDYYQSEEDSDLFSASKTVGHKQVRTLEMVYNYDVTKAGSSIDQNRQIGVQANYFTEKTFGFEKHGKVWTPNQHLVYMCFPRVIAVAERAWSPESKKNAGRFIDKMQTQFLRFDASGLDGFCEDERLVK